MEKIKQLLFFLLSIFLLPSATAQNKYQYSTESIPKAIIQVYDGSVFIGEITNEDELTLDVLITTGDTIKLKKAYIKRIRRSDKDILLHESAKFHYTKGRFFSLQFGTNFDEFDDTTVQLEFIAGYRFNKKITAGLGFGVSHNSTFFGGNWIGADAVPLFAYGRYYPFDKKVRPYIAGKLGWGFPNTNSVDGNHTGGMLVQPEIGIHFSSRKKTRLLLAVGQQIQNIRGTELDFDNFGNPIISRYKLWFNRTVLKIGVEWR